MLRIVNRGRVRFWSVQILEVAPHTFVAAVPSARLVWKRDSVNRWVLVACFVLLVTLPREGIVSGSASVSKAQKYYLIYKVTPGFDPDPSFGRGNASAQTDYQEEAKRELERVSPKLDAFIEALIADDNKYKIAPYRPPVPQFDSILPAASRNRRDMAILGFHMEMIFLDIPSDATVSALERKLQKFFAEYKASEKKAPRVEADPFPPQSAPAMPARYRLHVEGRNVSPASFPGDPAKSERNVRNVFDTERRRQDSDLALAESLYGPLLQEFFSRDHAYRKFLRFAGDENDNASITIDLLRPVTSTLTLYFDKKLPLLLQQVVSFQLLALMGRRNDNFRRWEQDGYHDYANAEALSDAIDYGFTYHNSRAGIAFGPQFMTSAAKHREVVKQLASREPMPTDESSRKIWSPDKKLTKDSCAIVVAKILHNYFANSQDVPAMLADLMRLESNYYLFERERRDALWAMFLGFMEDDDYSLYKNDICNALHVIPPLRKPWAVSSKTLDWSKLPKNAVVQIDGPNPNTDITALARALCPSVQHKAK